VFVNDVQYKYINFNSKRSLQNIKLCMVLREVQKNLNDQENVKNQDRYKLFKK